MPTQTRLRSTIFLTLVVALFLVPPSLVSAAGPDPCNGDPPVPGQAPELCGTTLIRGDGPASMRVHLAADVMLNGNFFDKANNFTIEGEGDYVGFVLSEAVPGRTGKTVLAYRGPGQWFGEPEASVDHKLFEFDPAADATEPVAALSTGEVSVPAGTYDLYLIAEGKPVTVTLTLAGLSGETELLPTESANIRSETVTPTTGRGTVSSATGSLLSPGIFQSVSWVFSTQDPWALATGIRGGAELKGYGASQGRPPVYGVRVTHTFWSPPREWNVNTTVAAPSGTSMVHGLWLDLGDVGAQTSLSDPFQNTSTRVPSAGEVDRLVETLAEDPLRSAPTVSGERGRFHGPICPSEQWCTPLWGGTPSP